MSEDMLPPGAVPSDVADNVEIKASEGEYIIPANVVRFIGLDKLEKLVGDATEKLAEMDAAGRIGGEEEDLDLEALFAEDPVVEEEAPAFAEGGMVEAETTPMFNQTDGFAGVKTFTDEQNNKKFIPFFGGKPLYPIPSGYSESSAVDVNKTPQSLAAQSNMSTQPSSPAPLTDNDPSPNEGNQKKGRPGDVNKWSVDDFLAFGNKKSNIGDKAVGAMITAAIPGGALALKARNAYLDRATSSAYDKMIETGLDLQGNAIPQDKLSQLQSTRAGIKKDMADQSGLNLNPIDRLTDAWDKFSGFLGGKPSQSLPTAQPVSVSSRGGGSRPSDATGISKTYNASQGSDAKGRSPSQGKDRALGSDIGKSGPTSGSMASGGLYKKGGLVKRSKKGKV